MVVEDNPIATTVIKMILKKLGCEVELVDDGIGIKFKVDDVSLTVEEIRDVFSSIPHTTSVIHLQG